jgi:cyclase
MSVSLSRVDLQTTSLRDNVRVYTLGGESIATSYGANCTAVAGRECVLLVDPLIAPKYASQIEIAVASWTSLPIRFVVVTHHHTDHALGAGYFASRGVTVVAHSSCRDRMDAEHAGLIESRRRHPDLAALFDDAQAYRPAVVLEKDLTIDLGGTEARILHPGPGHTPGDLVVHLPTESVAICGDLVSSGYHVNYEDASIENLDRGLGLLSSFHAQSYVPGHGPAGDSRLLDAQLDYHHVVRNAVEKSSLAADALQSLRAAFPAHLLEEVVSSAPRAWARAP